MRVLLAGAALGTILLASVGSAAPGVAQPRTIATAGPVLGLAADGDRAALEIGLPGRCASVLVWAPMHRRMVPLLHRGKCDGLRKDAHAPALAGTRAAWYWRTGGNSLETIVLTATLAHPAPVRIAQGEYGDLAGDGATSCSGRSGTERCSHSASSGAAGRIRSSSPARPAASPAKSSTRASGGWAGTAPARA